MAVTPNTYPAYRGRVGRAAPGEGARPPIRELRSRLSQRENKGTNRESGDTKKPHVLTKRGGEAARLR